MGIAPIPDNEAARLAALCTYGVLDTDPDPAFDGFARLVSEVCEVPVALISLVDESRQWFKARVGLPSLTETPRSMAICAHALDRTTVLEIPDTTVDARCCDNPLVTGDPHFRFYAGAPLIDRDGYVLGTLCVLDYRPRSLSDHQRSVLAHLAEVIVELIDTRKGVDRQQLDQIDLLSAALRHAAEPMAIISARSDDGRRTIVFVNDAFAALFKYDAVALIGQSTDILFGERTDVERIARLRATSALGESVMETVYVYPASGDPVLAEIHDRKMMPAYRIVSIKDLTRSRAAEKAILNSNRRLHSLFANNTDAVLTLDTRGRCVDANAAASALFGLSREKLLGCGFLKFATSGLFPNGEVFPATLIAGEPLTYRLSHGATDGRREQIVEYKAIPILISDDACDGAYVIAKDITARVETTTLLQEQATRTHALCSIAGTKGLSEHEQIERALRTVLDALDMQFGYVGEIVGDSIHIVRGVGEQLVSAGDIIPLRATYVKQTLDHGAAFAIDDMSSPDFERGDGLPKYADWHGYISAPLTIDNELYGAIGFMARRPIHFKVADCEFVTLVAALVATSIERQRKRNELKKLAFIDVLTGLPNRASVLLRLEEEISRAKRQRRAFAVHFIDLDGFKEVNDRFGHAAGDRVLQEVGQRLRRILRREDVPGRLGGDEFIVLQAEVERAIDPRSLGSRIIDAISEPYDVADTAVRIGASVGIAIYPGDGNDAEALLKRADAALYRAKARGKERVEVSEADRLATGRAYVPFWAPK